MRKQRSSRGLALARATLSVAIVATASPALGEVEGSCCGINVPLGPGAGFDRCFDCATFMAGGATGGYSRGRLGGGLACGAIYTAAGSMGVGTGDVRDGICAELRARGKLCPEMALHCGVQPSSPMSCEDLIDYIKNTGVTDASGKSHPGYSGWTTYDIPIRFEPTLDRNAGSGAGVCLKTSEVSLEGIFSIRPVSMSWTPSGPISAGCQAEKNRLEKEIADHEQGHVQDIRLFMEQQLRLWERENRVFEGCGSTRAEAKAALKGKIKSGLTDFTATLHRAIETKADIFHMRNPSTPIDCSRCP